MPSSGLSISVSGVSVGEGWQLGRRWGALAAIGAEDLIFWLGSAVYMFVQIYHTSDGSIRWYFILGVALGVILMWVFLNREEKLFKKIYGKEQKDLRQGLDKKEEKS